MVRVHKLVPKSVWSKRYGQINDFERMLADSGVKILKFFLHISKDEQKRRFEAAPGRSRQDVEMRARRDFEERKHWDDYTAAFEDALTQMQQPSRRRGTSFRPTRNGSATWPFRRSSSRRSKSLKMKYPKLDFDPKKIVIK